MLTEKYDNRSDTERLDAYDGRGGASHLLEARLLYVPTIFIIPIYLYKTD